MHNHRLGKKSAGLMKASELMMKSLAWNLCRTAGLMQAPALTINIWAWNPCVPAGLMQAEGTAWARPVVVPSAKGDPGVTGAPLVPKGQSGPFDLQVKLS